MSKYVVTATSGSTVNMREQGDKNAAVITAVPIGASIDILDRTDSQWYKIKYQDLTGYMMSKFIKEVNLQAIYDSLKKTLQLLEDALK